MKHTVFEGTATAIVTPMKDDLSVDYEALGQLIDFQLESGINAIVAVGTTGESATLEYAEQKDVIRFTVDRVAGRVPVIAGAGTNNTLHVLENVRNACEAGADALLVVTPYYNKATQNGLVAHFTAVADTSTVPVILYNVPGRTGCNLLPKTVAKLAEHPNIVGIKEASGNMAQLVELMALCGDKLDVYSGEDALNVPIMSIGGKGAISVLSNIAPKESVAMTDACLGGNYAEAAKWQCKMLPLIQALFCEVNPIPAKAAVAALGFGRENVRMPLSRMEEPNRQRLLAEMRSVGLAV